MIVLIRWAPLTFYVGLLLLLFAARATAHEWYSKRNDPVTNGGCCGGSDCAQLLIEPGVLEAVPEGYRIKLSLAQAQRINKFRYLGVDTIVPWARVQDSEDGNFHLCLPMDNGRVKDDVFCFFAPPNT